MRPAGSEPMFSPTKHRSGLIAALITMMITTSAATADDHGKEAAATSKFVWALMTSSTPGELRYCRDLPLMGLICHKIRQVQAGSFGLLHMDIGDEADEKRNFLRQAGGEMVDAMPYAPTQQAKLTPNHYDGIVKRDKKRYRLTLAVETTVEMAPRRGDTPEIVRTRTIEWTTADHNYDRLRQVRDLAAQSGATEVTRRLDYLLD